ncbi:hypothetical protein EPUS_01243 [Endocarpon pusillum Z07020]|uniref:Transmembrane protein n=1 Tax=Endocarpon pusillum (strain Z07020 / HMAS-L-300199) TaxID=1263415 RepID=U1GE37_ENDPU|nr:uncharacterized protein EPUS_01243 [Endocarpon pusillum Z07020]ERF75877.1 hypothetical protein EPUS_01243 [Endocarpon pusillum Z07020]
MSSHYQQTDAHPLSEKETNTDDAKAKTTLAAVFDPSFPLPTLEPKKTPTTRYIQSFLVLFFLLAAGVMGARFFELSILQTSSSISTSPNPKSKHVLSVLGLVMPKEQLAVLIGVIVVLFLAMWFTGTIWIDWWELVVGYWWLSLAICVAVALLFLMAQERTDTIGQVD